MYYALCSMQYVLCTMYYELCTMHYALCTMHYVLCTMYYELCTMNYVLCNMYYALCTMHYVLCTMYYALFNKIQTLLTCWNAFLFNSFLLLPSSSPSFIITGNYREVCFSKINFIESEYESWIDNLTSLYNISNIIKYLTGIQYNRV